MHIQIHTEGLEKHHRTNIQAQIQANTDSNIHIINPRIKARIIHYIILQFERVAEATTLLNQLLHNIIKAVNNLNL